MLHIFFISPRPWIIALALLSSYSCSSDIHPKTFVADSGPAVNVVETTPDQAMLFHSQPSVVFKTGGTAVGPTITVNDSIKYQQMDGFGASLTDSSAWLVANKLTVAQQNSLWQSLFSSTGGIGISFSASADGCVGFLREWQLQLR